MKTIIKKDIIAYAREYKLQGGIVRIWLHLMLHNRSFRSLYYYRKGKWAKLYSWLLPGESTLHLPKTQNIGSGILFFHSYGTIISPHAKIGDGCRITCNVTIGFKNGKSPIIGKNVEILPGAVIAGDVTIGDDCVIGPNAVVYKSVPANCVVVGNPAYILKENGVKVNRPL